MELPMPVQQAKHPLQSPQSARTMSFRLYNLPSEISLRLMWRSIGQTPFLRHNRCLLYCNQTGMKSQPESRKRPL